MKRIIRYILRIFCRVEFWVILGLLVYLLLNRYPLLPCLGSAAYSAGADYYIFTWILAWNCHALETFNFSHYWAGNTMYPYPYTLAFSENLLGITPFSFPVWLASHNSILTINVTMLLLVWFTAITTFLIFKKIIGNSLSALIGTFITVFYPYNLRSFTIGHPHMLALLWIPIIIYANWMFWREHKWKYWWIIVFLWFWSFLMSLYQGIFLTVMLILWNFLWMLYERNLFTLRKIMQWCIGLAIVWMLMAPVFWVYYQVANDMGVIRTLENQLDYTGNVWSWFSIAEDNWLWAQKIDILPAARLYSREDAMFPGLLTFVIFIMSFFLKNMPEWLKSLRWTGIAMAVFAIGPYTLGIPWKIPLPYIALWHIFPPLAATRNPHRWSIFVLFVAGIVAAWVCKNFPYRPKINIAIRILIALGLCIELWTYSVPRDALSLQEASLYKAIHNPKEKHVVLELPMASGWFNWVMETRPMVAATYHWNNTINGISGLWPSLQFNLGRELKEFPSTHTIKLLQSLEVDTIIIHEDAYYDYLPILLHKIQSRKEFKLLFRHPATSHNTYSVWHLEKGTVRDTFNPDTDLRIIGPSKLVEGIVTLGIEVSPACHKILFNPKAPAYWRTPMSKPWGIISWGLNPGGHIDSEKWVAPGLFHPRVCVKPFTVSALAGEHVLETEIKITNKEMLLKKNYTVVHAQKSSIPLPAFLKLPENHTAIPLDQVAPKIISRFIHSRPVLPGDMLEGDIEIMNPGPYYWAVNAMNDYPLKTRMECDINNAISRLRLPHDLFPGDTAILHIVGHIPYNSNHCRLLLSWFDTPESKPFMPYLAEIWQMTFPRKYSIQNVDFRSNNLLLKGTLFIPHQIKNSKVILLAHGFHRLGKDHPLYKEMAQRFAEKGYLVFSFDFRGFNASESPATITSPADLDYLSDISSAVDYLKNHFRTIDSIIIVGHSFGAGVSVSAGLKNPFISKIVSIAPARRTQELFFGKNPSLGVWWIQDRMNKDGRLSSPIPLDLLHPIFEPLTVDHYRHYVFKKPILFVDGALEDPKDLEFLKAYFQSIKALRKNYLTIPDATHFFGTTFIAQIIDSSVIQNLVDSIDNWITATNEPPGKYGNKRK